MKQTAPGVILRGLFYNKIYTLFTFSIPVRLKNKVNEAIIAVNGYYTY